MPTQINHPQERAELLGECWSQQEAPRPLLLLLSSLLSSSEGEESQKRSGHDAEKSSCRDVAKWMLRGLLVPSQSPPEQSRSMCFIWCFVASKLSPGLLQTLGISSRCADGQLQSLFWLRYRPEFRRAGVKGELCSAL